MPCAAKKQHQLGEALHKKAHRDARSPERSLASPCTRRHAAGRSVTSAWNCLLIDVIWVSHQMIRLHDTNAMAPEKDVGGMPARSWRRAYRLRKTLVAGTLVLHASAMEIDQPP